MTQLDAPDENNAMDTAGAPSANGAQPKKPRAQLTAKHLRELIDDVSNHVFTADDKWYVVSNLWWKKLINTAKQGFIEDITEIDNENISEKQGGRWVLRSGLCEGVDFTLVPQEEFQTLQAAFNVADSDRDVIERRVVENPAENGKLIVEVYPKIVTICPARDQLKSVQLRIAPSETMEQLRTRALKELGMDSIPVDRLRFYIAHKDGAPELLDVQASSVLSSVLSLDEKVLVDEVDEKGVGFIGSASSSSSSGGRSLFGNSGSSVSSSSYGEGGSWRSGGGVRGVCGLQNLGNTCFMASALQCLSNVPPITEYFESKKYIDDINETNPLGTQGELARAYGHLIHDMWSGQNSSVVPRKLKSTIGQFAPRFSGYSQQDSQELLAYLLDGLHEDLNRVKVKPYIEEEEAKEGEPEHEVAERAWQQYSARNDSVIVDRVHGQLKSTLVCPVCSKVSIKFDPFCFLSVPLPPKERPQRVNVTLMFNPAKKWAKFAITCVRSTLVSEMVDVMRANLGQPDMNVAVYHWDSLSDRVEVVDGSQPVLSSDGVARELLAMQLTLPSTRLVLVRNRNKAGKSLTYPMLYAVEKEDSVTRNWVEGSVLSWVRATWESPSEAVAPSAAIDDDDSMNGGERSEPIKLYMENRGAVLPFPVGDESPVAWPADVPVQSVVVEWRDAARIRSYKGADLVERECSAGVRTQITLSECVDLFTKEEQLGEQDSWYCPRCKKHERASKKLDLWKLPEVLIVHLKRFQYSRWSREKIDIPVVIPVKNFELNSKLANSRHEEVKYDLIGVSHHMGGLGGGHYTATAVNKNSGKWYDFNDSCTSQTEAPRDPWTARSPYMLVYRRHDAAQSDGNIEMEAE